MRIPGLSGVMTATVFLAPVIALGLWHPETPLPDPWNPTRPLRIVDAVTPVTSFKLRHALGSPEACLSVLSEDVITPLEPFTEPDNPLCGIERPVEVSSIAGVATQSFETDCRVALQTAMWVEHSVKPAAERLLGVGLEEVRHASSYVYRPIRTSEGAGQRISTHSTATAIDVTGFRLTDGRTEGLSAD